MSAILCLSATLSDRLQFGNKISSIKVIKHKLYLAMYVCLQQASANIFIHRWQGSVCLGQV